MSNIKEIYKAAIKERGDEVRIMKTSVSQLTNVDAMTSGNGVEIEL